MKLNLFHQNHFLRDRENLSLEQIVKEVEIEVFLALTGAEEILYLGNLI